MMRRPPTSSCLLLIFALSACVDNGTENASKRQPSTDDSSAQQSRSSHGPSGFGGPGADGVALSGGGFGHCIEVTSAEVQLDERTALGFSAREVLAFVEGTHEETITWHPQTNASIGPESGQHHLTITITRKGELPRVTHYDLDTNDAHIGGDCQDALEVDANLQVQTDEGALNENIDITVRAYNSRIVSLFLHPRPAELGGTFRVQAQQSGLTLVQLDLLLQFTAFGVSGELGAVLGMHLDDASGGATAAASSQPLATWGPARCGFASSVAAVPLDASVADFSGEDVLQRLRAVSQAAVVWAGDTAATDASISFERTGEAGVCARFDASGFVESGRSDLGALTFEGVLTMRSEDGRIDAALPVQVNAMPAANGAIGDVTLMLDSRRVPQNGSLQVRYGLSGVDDSPYGSVSVNLTLTLSETTLLTGELKVTGFTNSMCSTAPIVRPDGSWSVAPCQGAAPTELASAQIAAPA